MIGRVHSIESMGLMDGPGIRMVLFMQGCPIRCKYCHNPDSQEINAGELMEVDEIVDRAKRLKPYFERSGGGITVSGGEPLLQADFLYELFSKLRAEGICTTLDTSGYGNPKTYDKLLSVADLVLLDLKHYKEPDHYDLVGAKMSGQEPFIEALIRNKTRLWIRHVMVPGLTDNHEAMVGLAKRIIPLKEKIEKIEILPYMTLGVSKYEEMGLNYELEGVPAMDKKRAKEFEKELIALTDWVEK